MEIERRDAATAAPSGLSLEGDEKHGPTIALHHTRRHDAHHTGVPVVAGQHKSRARVTGKLQFHLRQRLVLHRLIQPLTFAVEFLQLGCKLAGLGKIVAQ